MMLHSVSISFIETTPLVHAENHFPGKMPLRYLSINSASFSRVKRNSCHRELLS